MKRREFIKTTVLGTGALVAYSNVSPGRENAKEQSPLVLAVMDPLAIDLACACIEGFAQRKYRVLAEHLKTELDRPVSCLFSNALKPLITKSPTGKVDLIIGKDAEVKHYAKEAAMKIKPVAKLTNKDDKTTFRGYFIVKTEDAATSLADLKNHKIVFGPEYSTEKRIEPVKMLEKAGVVIPEKPYFKNTCKDAALEIVENESAQSICALSSDYALVLLEGCETIEKGVLRILEKTPEVPFITAFTSNDLDAKTARSIQHALFSFAKTEKNLAALESKSGFIPFEK